MLEGSFLKNDEFLVTVRSPFWVVIMLPFLCVICNGSGLNGVDILFCFGCLVNTLSPMLRSVLLALLHLSAYSFIFSFLVASACLISGEASSYCTRGRVDLSFLPFSNSEGDYPVVL